jgi:hypothetical protein
MRKKSIVMTQTDPKTPRADQFQGGREAVQGALGDEKMNSPKRLARIAGFLYLLVIGVRTQKPDGRILAPVRDPVAVDLRTH